MNINKLILSYFCGLVVPLLHIPFAQAASTGNAIQETPHIKVQMLTDSTNFSLGHDFRIGVLFQIEDGWHIYSKNPGDSGLPTKVEWSSDNSFSFSDLQYPPPKQIHFGELTSFGYEKEVLLSSTVFSKTSVSANSERAISAKVTWVLCKDECIPGSAKLDLHIGGSGINTSQVQPSVFEKYYSSQNWSHHQTVLLMLCSAFIGGLILNLMPCVFPVLSLKLLEISRLGTSKSAGRHSLVFAAGVISSFVALASLLIALKSVGLEIGWGFQFQSPVFVALIALLTFTIGLNLSGVFDIGFSLQNKAGSVQVSDSYTGSFLSGVLATTLATPCTAPFMGTAIAFALAAPLYQAFFVFLILGVGMSSPYVVLAYVPALTRFIPRPGAWMETFKQALAFPMYATTTWLLWVLSVQADIAAVIASIGALVVVGAGMWIFGTWGTIHCSYRSRLIAKLVTAGLLACGAYVAVANLPQENRLHSDSQQLSSVTAKGVGWERYSNQRLNEVLGENKTVLIDFTAAWCLVCQVNHTRVLESPKVLDELKNKGVVLLRADWTTGDPEIGEALTRFGHSGVPLLVLMSNSGKPKQFESLVSQSELLSALESLTKVA